MEDGIESISTSSSTSSPPKPRDDLKTIWISFTGYTCENFKKSNVIFEFCSGSRREFSKVVRASSSGRFSSSVECAIAIHAKHSFVLYQLASRSRTVDKASKQIARFSFDLFALSEEIASSKSARVSKTAAAGHGVMIQFDASDAEPILSEAEDVAILTAFQDDFVDYDEQIGAQNASGADVSFSSVSEDGDLERSFVGSDSFSSSSSGRRHARKGSRVHFDRETHTIPSTHQLQKEIQKGVEERSKLAKSVDDLSIQLSQVKHDVSGVKESIRRGADSEHSKTSRFEAYLNEGKMESRRRSSKRRRVVLDGDSIVRSFGSGNLLPDGLEVVLEYYRRKNVGTVAVLSRSTFDRMDESAGENGEVSGKDRIHKLIEGGVVSVASSHSKRGHFIVRYALDNDADIVSNDSFRCVVKKHTSRNNQRRMQLFLESHRYAFMFIGGQFVPSASNGLRLSESLSSLESYGRGETV